MARKFQEGKTISKILLCLGYGFTARHLARILPDWTVYGTIRNDHERLDDLSVLNCVSYSNTTAISELIATATHILISVPPGADGDPVLQTYTAAIANASQLDWVGYLSTTGVYGDLGGDWADETAPYNPSGKRGQRRVAAEKSWLDLFEKNKVPVHIFRLAGIYGPGRNQLVSLRQGTARRIDKPGQVFSRIHVDDIAEILKRSMAHPIPGRIYNICDDEAAPPQDVVAWAAQLLDMEAPPLISFAAAELSPMGRSFYDDNKRLYNDRVKSDLNYDLKYPTYREGLAALLKEI